jgi:hypothetical protein
MPNCHIHAWKEVGQRFSLTCQFRELNLFISETLQQIVWAWEEYMYTRTPTPPPLASPRRAPQIAKMTRAIILPCVQIFYMSHPLHCISQCNLFASSSMPIKERPLLSRDTQHHDNTFAHQTTWYKSIAPPLKTSPSCPPIWTAWCDNRHLKPCLF